MNNNAFSLFRRNLYMLFVGLSFSTSLAAGTTVVPDGLPVIGAQVIIEPGQPEENLDLWFRRLSESGMKVCRIRMFEDYMKDTSGQWDFSLFDKAFETAHRHGIKVFATLFPSAQDNSIGGFKFPVSFKHRESIERYIASVVSHFKNCPALYSWVLMNEPGTGGNVPDNEFTRYMRLQWQDSYPSRRFSDRRFLVYLNTSYLKWLSEKVLENDNSHELHVNSHQIFENVAEYDFSSWRPFLSTFGASAHPSWHYGYFCRSEYPYAMSANCAIVRSGAGTKPFWITELQGGNNTYSGMNPFCPTADEIVQWLWTSVASGAKGTIFWSLNSRSEGEEAGEWALLDFQNSRTDRMEAASSVAAVLEDNSSLFSDVSPEDNGISLLYSRSSLWTENAVRYNDDIRYEGRQSGGVMKSVLEYYEILSECGMPPSLMEIGEYDWTKNDYSGKAIVLANMISVPEEHWDHLRHFVATGGSLFVEGLTCFYDGNMRSLYSTSFPLSDVFGGTVSEFKCTPGDFTIDVISRDPSGLVKDKVPVHLWKGYATPANSSFPDNLILDGADTVGIVNKYGNGKVIWIPSLLGMGARRSGDGTPLAKLLAGLLPSLYNSNIRLSRHEEDIFMQTAKGRAGRFSVIVNKSQVSRRLGFFVPEYKSRGGKNERSLVFASKCGHISGNKLFIGPEETVVIRWEHY